jgi:hypothetical protein
MHRGGAKLSQIGYFRGRHKQSDFEGVKLLPLKAFYHVKNSFFSVLLFLLLFWSAGLSAQDNNTKPSPAPKTSIGLKGQVEEDARLLYMYERSFGIMVHSHGFAVNYRRGRSFGERKKGLFDIELSTLRHSKEFRIASGSISNSGSYVYGKLNSVMLVRTG